MDLNNELFKIVIRKYGIEAQLNMLIEECAELIVAINHFKRNRKSFNSVLEEIADVFIVANQFKYKYKKIINPIINSKLKRLKEKLNKEDLSDNNNK